MVFLLILPSQTYPDAVKVWTHWYMYTLYRSPADHWRDHTSMNPLIYVYSVQIPSWSQMWSNFVLPPPKKVFCITPWWVFAFDLGISTNMGRGSTPKKSGNLLEDQEKSGKFDIFFKKSVKSKGRKYLCMQIFNL